MAEPTPNRDQRAREFRQHLFLYVLVNGGLWAIWIIVGLIDGFGFLYPVFPTVLWGIALLIHGVIVWRDRRRDDVVSSAEPHGEPGRRT